MAKICPRNIASLEKDGMTQGIFKLKVTLVSVHCCEQLTNQQPEYSAYTEYFNNMLNLHELQNPEFRNNQGFQIVKNTLSYEHFQNGHKIMANQLQRLQNK